jgi:hypothetical protein
VGGRTQCPTALRYTTCPIWDLIRGRVGVVILKSLGLFEEKFHSLDWIDSTITYQSFSCHAMSKSTIP